MSDTATETLGLKWGSRVRFAIAMPERFAKSLCFVSNDGTELWPVMIRNRGTGEYAYQILADGSNRTAEASHTTDERELQRLVRIEERRVRCKAISRPSKANAYSVNGRSVKIRLLRDLLK